MSRRGLGGPQPEEVTRMLGAHRQQVGASLRWLDARRATLGDAHSELDAAFTRLVNAAR